MRCTFPFAETARNENKGTPSTIHRGVTVAPSSQSKAQAIPTVRMKNPIIVSSLAVSQVTGTCIYLTCTWTLVVKNSQFQVMEG